MTMEIRPLVEITQEAIRLLYKELGVVNTVRFLNQFTGGLGDYTREQQEFFASKTLDEIVIEIRRSQEPRSIE